MKNLYYILSIFLLFSLSSCTREGCTDPNSLNYDSKAKVDDGSCTYPQSEIRIQHQFAVDGEPLNFFSKDYINAAGNNYSVTFLVFYTSQYTLHNVDGSNHVVNIAHYHDAAIDDTRKVILTDIPQGTYNKISFLVGLPPEMNVFGNLPATQENNNMFWPEPMGGGYHYMKLEGKFIDDNGRETGHATHLGRLNMDGLYANPLVLIELPIQNITVNNNNHQVNLEMNINNWFQTPNVYDMNSFTHGSMFDTTALRLLGENGHDVYSLINVQPVN